MTQSPSVPSTPVPLWRRFVPWTIAALLVGFILSRVDIHEVGSLLRAVSGPLYGAFILAFTVVNLVCDCLAISRVYTANGMPETLRSILVVRGASYLPAILNYHLGQAYLTYLIAKHHGRKIVDVARGTLVAYATMLGAFALVAAVGMTMPVEQPPWVLRTVSLLIGGGVVYLGVLWMRPEFLADHPLTKPLFDVGAGGHVVLLLWRLPHVLVLSCAVWVNYTFFGVIVPLRSAVAIVPLILLVAALPLTPQGVGTREIVAIHLLIPYVGGTFSDRAAPIVAAGAAWTLGTIAAQAAVGLFFMRKTKEIPALRS